MAFRPLSEELPDLAEQETRTLFVLAGGPEDVLPEAGYTFVELYCDEPGCDCRRVFFYVESTLRPGPEAVIAWGWESPAFYARWLGDDDPEALAEMTGPTLNLGSWQSEWADLLVELVKNVLITDLAYAERIQEHYRLFRECIARSHPARNEAGRRGSSRRRYLRYVPIPLGDLPVDPRVVRLLAEAGLKTNGPDRSLSVALQIDEDGEVLVQGETVFVTDGEQAASVELKEIGELFRGDRRPPSLDGEPPPAYTPFFMAIERAAYEYCAASEAKIRDKEFEKVYNDLRRRPDGAGEYPVSYHLQAALRLYLSLHEVSQLEYEAVMRRLSRSARTFAEGYTSTNYFDRALRPVFGTTRQAPCP